MCDIAKPTQKWKNGEYFKFSDAQNGCKITQNGFVFAVKMPDNGGV
jgi:hypothetical protein